MNFFKFCLLLLALVLISAFFHFCLETNFNSEVRFVNDSADRDVYYLRGSWYPLKKVPYLEVFSEYPQAATYFFALPHAMLLQIYGDNYTEKEYRLVFSGLMMILLSLLIMLLYNMRVERKYFAFLLLLPATLYFSYNRYDILPAALSVFAVFLLTKEKYLFSAFILAIGVLAKWYLIVLFPVFLNFYYFRRKKLAWNMISVFCLTGILGILPTLLSGGVKALVVPYVFHAARGNGESLFYLLKKILGSDAWFFIFFLLQFSVIPLCLIAKIDSLKKVLNWSCLSILIFMLFAKFYSPQWILWILPFFILRSKNMKDVLLIVLFDLITYLYFPVIYIGFPKLLYSITVAKTILLLYFVVILAKAISGDIDRKIFSRFRLVR